MKRSWRIVLAASLGAAGLALLAGVGGAAREATVTLTVGNTQDVDTLNPAVGALVIDYEVWNMQYPTLTRKAPSDFHTIPGLATSWKSSNHSKTWTYKLRPNLKWSDGVRLTSEDVAYTVNRARKEGWLNYSAFIGNITAKAPNPRTLVLTTSVPDPRLPGLGDTYVVPKHVYEKTSAKNLTKYPATDGVGAGPFTLDKFVKGQYVRMKANPAYWGGTPKVDQVVFRLFTNPDAMVFALKKGEIDAANNIPAAAFKALQSTKGIVALQGQQGSFDELALNGYNGKPPRSSKFSSPNPALKDLRVRQAIAHAIDKKALVSRAYQGIGTPADAISPGASPEWLPKIPASLRYDFDLGKAKKLLDQAGYKDTDGDGIRNLPGGKDIVLRYLIDSESEVSRPIAQFVTSWLKDIGIGTKTSVFNETQLIVEIGKGAYDLFTWGWTPFVDPDPELSYFQCNQVAHDAGDFTNYYNDSSWCDPVYDKLYAKQRVELNHSKRVAIVHQMLTRFYRSATYDAIEYSPEVQAYRTDRFTGWLRQPGKIGPVLFTNTSPTYANLRPIK